MITRKEIRDRAVLLLSVSGYPGVLTNREYRFKYYDTDGTFKQPVKGSTVIPDADVEVFVDDYLGIVTVSDEDTFIFVTITSDRTQYLTAGGWTSVEPDSIKDYDATRTVEETRISKARDPDVEAQVDLLDTNFTYTPYDDKGNAGTEEIFSDSLLTDDEVYDIDLHGPAIEDGTKVWTYAKKSTGEFFEDLNKECLLAAAVYELMDVKITALEARVAALENA